MPAAPLVAKKLKAGSSAEAIGEELDRRAHVYANEIHPERTPDNEYWVGGEWVAGRDGAKPEALDEAIERRMGELNTKRKIRSDAVKAEGFVLSSNSQLDERSAVEFLKEGVEWMAERYGVENLLAAAIHVDEDTPHAQFWIAPVIHGRDGEYDRLSAKELFTPNKLSRDRKTVVKEGTLTKLQRDFYREVSSRYGFSEPFTADQRMANGKVYKSQAAFKADSELSRIERRSMELNTEIADKEGDLVELESAIEDKQLALEGLGERIERDTQRLECLQRRIEEAELEPAQETVSESVRALCKARGDGAREGRLAEEIEGLRERISELEGERGELGERRARLDARVEYLRGGLARARERFEGLAARVDGYIANVGQRVAALLQSLGVRAYAGNPPLSERVGMERAAARAYNAERAARGEVPHPSRGDRPSI